MFFKQSNHCTRVAMFHGLPFGCQVADDSGEGAPSKSRVKLRKYALYMCITLT